MRSFTAAWMVLAITIGSVPAPSAEKNYTRQERDNMAVVRGLWNALNAAEARGDETTAIVGIADKYIAEDFRQHGKVPRDRTAWMAIFQAGGLAAQANAGLTVPGATNATPGNSVANSSVGAAPSASALPLRKEIAVMADGDRVTYVCTRDGEVMIYHLFRVKDGKIAEMW